MNPMQTDCPLRIFMLIPAMTSIILDRIEIQLDAYERELT